MADREKASLEVTVSEYCDAELMSICVLVMELDDEYNAGKSCFSIGEDAYYRIYGNVDYTSKSTLGTPRRDSAGVGETIEDEYVIFSSWIGSASKPINSILNYEWVGKSLGTVHKVKGTNSLTADRSKHDGYGVIRLNYTTRYDRWKISSPEEADVVVYALGKPPCEDTSASLTIEFRENCAESEDNYVTLTFKNYNTGELIVGASVWVDGVYRGLTNSQGKLYLGLMAGGTHTVRATHPNYSPTQADLLGNDYFVVSG